MLEIKYKPKPEKEKNASGLDGEEKMTSAGTEEKTTCSPDGENTGSGETKEETVFHPDVQEEKESRKNRRREGRKKGRLPKFLLTAGLIVVTLLLTFAFSIWREYSRTDTGKGKAVEVTVEKGMTTRQMAKVLKDAGVIRYESAFLLKIYFSDARGKLRYGTFQLNEGMSLERIIKEMTTGGAQKKEESFTIPEGYSVPMIAAKLEKEKIMTKEEFLQAVKKAADDFAGKDLLPDQGQVFYQLEGYLFPDTYYLSENMTGEQLVKKILDEFMQKFDEKRQEEAKALGMTMEEVLIRASLVQKETETPSEYPTIAGVINNRLRQNMRLQFDSTVVYALSEGMYGVDRVLYGHLEVESPYNTYKNNGLPIGPICNPSLEAIDGVLHPEEHEYLYFQADQVKNDGTNLYFKTYEEHAAAAATTEVTAAGEMTTAKEKPADKETENTVSQTP